MFTNIDTQAVYKSTLKIPIIDHNNQGKQNKINFILLLH